MSSWTPSSGADPLRGWPDRVRRSERNSFGSFVSRNRRQVSGACSPGTHPCRLRELTQPLSDDDSGRGLDEREVGKGLRKVAEVSTGVDVELFGEEPERRGTRNNRSIRSRASCSSPMIANADTSQNEQMRKVPSLPDGPSSVSPVRYRSTKPFSVSSSAMASSLRGAACRLGVGIRRWLPGVWTHPTHRCRSAGEDAPLVDAVFKDVVLDLSGGGLPGRGQPIS